MYSELKKITRYFKEKLGEGGRGVVLKGSLQDDRVVAVKLLKGSKGNGEDFLNEVMSISQTSHVNIVSLLGFCLEGSKRALIYEYMPMVPWISIFIQSWILGGKCCSKLLLVSREDWSLASGMQHSHHTFRYQTSKHPSR